MKCRKCGALLHPNDRFCSQCGAAVKRKWKKDPMYDEHLFRDSFLDQTEEGHHALFVTLTAILLIALVTVGAIYLYAWLHSRDRQFLIFHNTHSIQETEQASKNGESGEEQEEAFSTETMTAGEDEDSQTEEQQTETDAGGDGTEEQSEQSTPAGEKTQTEKVPGKKQDLSTLDAAWLEEMLFEETTADDFSLYVVDLGSDERLATSHSDLPMYASATITVPILYTAASLLDEGSITLDDQILYVNSIGGRGEPDPEKRDGKPFALSYYLGTMLRYSDNNCVNCLIDYLTLPVINQTCQNAGYDSVDLERAIVANISDGRENYVSARDLAEMVKELYNDRFSALGRDFMKEYFRISELDGNSTVLGNASELPAEAIFLNQNGMGETRFSEVAVIEDDTHAFVISAMLYGSYGFDFETALEEAVNYIYTGVEDRA